MVFLSICVAGGDQSPQPGQEVAIGARVPDLHLLHQPILSLPPSDVLPDCPVCIAGAGSLAFACQQVTAQELTTQERRWRTGQSSAQLGYKSDGLT